MNKSLAIILIFAAMFAFACKTETDTKTVETKTNTTTATDTKKEMPKTEKAENKDFVPSEEGTEKAKPEAGKANVQGKVFFNEKPVPNVEVKICEKFNRFIGGCDGETFKTKTDENGEYLIANIPPKIYEGLLVQVFNTKAYIFATQGFAGLSSAKYNIEADKTFFAPETNLFKDDLKIQNPKAKSKADAASLEFKWDAYPDAAYYKLSVNPDKYESDSTSISAQKVEGTTYKHDKPLNAGEYRLSLEAYNANDVKLAESDDQFEFTVTGGAGSEGSANTKTP